MRSGHSGVIASQIQSVPPGFAGDYHWVINCFVKSHSFSTSFKYAKPKLTRKENSWFFSVSDLCCMTFF